MSYLELKKLAEHRRARALTQEELAKLAGVSRQTIGALEAGHRRAYESTARKLAKGLKVPPEALR